MSKRRCWTCNEEHDLDEPCGASPVVREVRAAGSPGNEIYDATTPDLFDDATKNSRFGPVFTAVFESDDACCGEGIEPGEDIRAGGHGGWIHADDTCERLAGA